MMPRKIEDFRSIEDLRKQYQNQTMLDLAHFAGFLSKEEEEIYQSSITEHSIDIR